MNDIIQIIDVLRDGHFYGAGPMTEIAKGKNEIDNYFRKIVRKWQSLKK